MKFRKCKLSELGEIVGGATPSTKNKFNYGGNISWITPKDLTDLKGRFINRGERNITKEGFENSSTKMLPINSVLFSSRAPIGYIAINNMNEVCTNQGFKSIIPNDKINYMFLYYLLKFNKDRIESLGSGTTFKEISGTVMKNIVVSIPENKNDQLKIAKVLSKIDEKIELNTHTNNNLYEIGKALYHEYFENDKYTSNYEIKQLSEVTTNNRNKIDDSKEYKVLSAVNTGKLVLSDDYFDKQVYSKDIGKYLNVNKNDFAYNPARINIGSIGLNTYDFNCCVSPAYVTFSVDRDYIDFFDFYFKSKRFNAEVTLRASGSVRQALNYNDFGMIEILYPSKEIINKFNKSYSKIKNRINKNKIKINNLEQIRDALLPKLMNGEIDLDKIEI